MGSRKGVKHPKTPGVLEKRNTQFSVLNRVSAAISQGADLRRALTETLDELLGVTGADIGSVHVLDDKEGDLQLFASSGVSREFICAEARIPVGECLCGEAARTGSIVTSSNLKNEPRLVRPACRDERFGSVVGIPLISRERVMGVLTLYARKTRAFSKADEELLTLVGYQTGTAIENARLSARTRDLAVLEERAAMAREIHDGIAQSLAYLNLETGKLEGLLNRKNTGRARAHLGQIRQVVQDAFGDVRELLDDVRDGLKEGGSFSDAVVRHVAEFRRKTGLRVDLVGLAGDFSLTPTAKVQMFRIIQEGLTNARKHARATRIRISFIHHSSELEVRIRDNGRGFDPSGSPAGNGSHLGIEIMRERAVKIGGRFRLESRPGKGADLRITVPLNPAGA